MILKIKNAKEILKEFSELYVFIPINYFDIENSFEKRTYVFTKNGFICIEDDIIYYLDEMTEIQASECLRLLPYFQEQINIMLRD